ncbi:MAG: glycosyltransferase [Phaeodactylibacter sp.]|nr:glycosyltransferase [Phaeodactylibacter sp.]MCB9275981.1 glycosyltransferase [Lewinellaceae bacterium]
MYNSFISIVGVINHSRDLNVLPAYLSNLYPILSGHFSDFEIILVNNNFGIPADPYIEPLPDGLKHNIYMLNLSRQSNPNHAILAGLDRSNGDYTVILGLEFYQQPEWVLKLFEKTREHYDIVYLRATHRDVGLPFRPFYRVFYYILKHYSALRIDEKAHNTRIISRRALNSLLRLRENLRYMKAIYSIVGYRTAHLETDMPLQAGHSEGFSDRFRTSLVAITSYTTFLRSLLLWIFIFSVIFLLGVIVNALKVKFSGVDLFGNIGEPFSGWTFLVILIAVFFATTCLNLYIMSIYLSNIYNEIKQRPLYIIESIKRF